METTTLREHRWTRGTGLTGAERDALTRAVPEIVVTPTSGAEGRFDLRPGAVVGSVRIGDRAFVIRPKIGFERTLYLVSSGIGRALWSDEVVDLARKGDVVEAVAAAFARVTETALRGGPLFGYRTEEDTLHTVRGAIRFADQLRIRLGIIPPVEVRYDEFTPDNEENRLLRAALFALRQSGLRSVSIARALREQEMLLDEVELVEYQPSNLPTIIPTRLNARYQPAIRLARLILRSISYELRAGNVRTSAFLINMNRAFEDFVVTALREALGVSEEVFPQSVRGQLFLDHARQLELRPDLSWWKQTQCVFVGDVKYKRTDLDGEPADLYQLLAYVVATGLDRGLLVYAAGEGEEAAHEVRLIGKRLEVWPLSLEGDIESIQGEIIRLAEHVRVSRRKHVRADAVGHRPHDLVRRRASA